MTASASRVSTVQHENAALAIDAGELPLGGGLLALVRPALDLLEPGGVLAINSVSFWWTISVFFRDGEMSNQYIAYMFTVILFNLAELIATIYTAIETRKGHHISWWFYGDLTDRLCKQ